MEVTPYPPIRQQSFERMCREWVDVILREESGTWIWPPLSAPYRRIFQFFHDKDLQRKLFGKLYSKQILVYVDFKQQENFTKEKIESVIKEALLESAILDDLDTKPLSEIIESIIKNGKTINLFIEGVDNEIRNKRWEIIEILHSLAQRNWQTHVLLFLHTNITYPEFFADFSKRTTLCQNITITSRYAPEETDHFIKYLSYNWNVTLSPEQIRWIKDNAGGRFLIIKEVVRAVTQKPKITYDELNQLSTLKIKGEANIASFLQKEQEVLILTADGQTIPDTLQKEKEFLEQIYWIEEKDEKTILTIPYMQKLLKQMVIPHKPSPSILSFTKTERNIYDYLQQREKEIVSREDIAKVLWGNESEEKYSDWAIDQAIHKLREKMEKEHMKYELKTKKGEGFVLITKPSNQAIE